MPEDTVTAVAAERITIPKERYAPEPEPTPEYRPDTPNYADKKDTVAKVLGWCRGYISDFKAQEAWDHYEDECDIADEMYRAAADREALNADQADNVQSTGSHVKSSSYHSDIRVITAGEKAVILGNEEQLPVVYEALPQCGEYTADEGQQIAEQENMRLAYTFATDKTRRKLGRYFLRLNKYGNQLVEVAWDYRREKRQIRTRFSRVQPDDKIVKAAKPRKSLRPNDIVFVERMFTVADNPTFIIHDMKDVRFDAMIEDIQRQSCLHIRFQRQLAELWSQQEVGTYANVGKLTTGQLYAGEGESAELIERQANAGEGGDANSPTTLFDMHRFLIRVPVDDDTGKWDADRQLPHWYEAVFSGDIDGEPVCLKLSPNQHASRRIPFFLGHSHDDDKGAIHLGYATLVKSIIAQEMTGFDQFIDNNTERNRKPWILERGSISIRDKTFSAGGNRIWWKRPGMQDPHEVEIQDITQQAIPMLGKVEEYRQRAMGTNKPFLGEALGSRTSASEAIGVLEQALKPAMEDAKEKAEVLEFVADWYKEMWDQFGDPQRELAFEYQEQPYTIRPADIWGPLKVRVTSVKRFMDNILRAKEEDRFMNQFFPLALKTEGFNPVPALKEIATNRGYTNIDDWWPGSSDFDARHVAKSENQAILFEGVWDMPKPGENDEAHLKEHEPYFAQWLIGMPDEERPPKAEETMQLHIMRHKQQLESQQAQQVTQPQQAEAAPGPRTAGEAAGDVMGAVAGGEENLPAGGRPPTYEGQPGMMPMEGVA